GSGQSAPSSSPPLSRQVHRVAKRTGARRPTAYVEVMTDFEQLRNDPELPRSCREAQLGGVVGRGWWPLIRELEAKLDQKFPDWCREGETGEGTQTPILSPPERVERIDYEAFNELIAAAERASASTCEECGEIGKLHVSERGWYRTLCSSCAKEQGFNEPPRR